MQFVDPQRIISDRIKEKNMGSGLKARPKTGLVGIFCVLILIKWLESSPHQE